MKIEITQDTGVMIVHGDKAWGVIYQDGQSTSYGWTDIKTPAFMTPNF